MKAATLSERLVGRWSAITEEVPALEFFNDGTVMDRESGWQGRWVVVGENRVKISYSVLGTDAALLMEEIRFSGDLLNFTMDGRRGEARRLP